MAPSEPATSGPTSTEVPPTESAPGEPAAEPPARGKRWSRFLKPKRERTPAPEVPDPVASLPTPRSPVADAVPEPAPDPDPAPDQAPDPASDHATSAPPLAPPRPGREEEEEHLDWISSLASDDNDGDLAETGRGRRRLRRDRDLSISAHDLPEPPSRPARRS